MAKSNLNTKRHYDNGKKAYLAGDKADCPLVSAAYRKVWYDGYYEAMIEQDIGHILNKDHSNGKAS
jgi:ribosome modulation factor